MEAERDRNGRPGARHDREDDGELGPLHTRLVSQLVGEGEARPLAEVEARYQPLAVELLHAPAGVRGQQTVDWQPAWVARAIVVEHDLPAGDLKALGGQPVGPRVEQRNAHRLAPLDVGLESAALAEHLRAAVAERAANHSGTGREARFDVAGEGEELDRHLTHSAGQRPPRRARCMQMRYNWPV